MLLPIGEYGLVDRLIAFKSTSFFALIYFAGRLFNPAHLYVNKYFHYILLVCIAAAVIVISEVLLDRHLQTLTGYGDYNYYFFNQEPTGDYGLTWTFELETGGLKRFASFFLIRLNMPQLLFLAWLLLQVCTPMTGIGFSPIYLVKSLLLQRLYPSYLPYPGRLWSVISL